MTRLELIGLAKRIAEKHSLDSALVCSLAHHESGNWKPWAIRYEPAFYNRYISTMKGISETEKQARAFSYGLCQVMGQVARELGFGGDYLTELLDPETNLEFACRKLKSCLSHQKGDVREALLEYNGGGNSYYPDLVLKHLKEYQ